MKNIAEYARNDCAKPGFCYQTYPVQHETRGTMRAAGDLRLRQVAAQSFFSFACQKLSFLMNHFAINAQPQLTICRADYADPAHAAALVALLDAYARDPAGGGHPLSEFAKTNLASELAARPQAFSVLAFDGLEAVGLVNCIEGFSTFACKPLVNVHDVAVLASHRGQRVGARMLELVEAIARERGACKLTLEVLAGNLSAARLYERIGFVQYQLDPAMGQALFLQKWI